MPFYCPDNVPEVSGKFVTRLPKSVHAKLTERAKAEGVSLSALVSVSTIEVVGFALILRRLPPHTLEALIAERGSDEKIRVHWSRLRCSGASLDLLNRITAIVACG